MLRRAEDRDVHLDAVVERGLDERDPVELEGELERLLELVGVGHARDADRGAERAGFT